MDDVVRDKIEKFFSQQKKQSYKKGEILIRADENPAYVYYLQEGFVKMYAISKKGDELVLNIFKPTSFFPMNSAINSTTNYYYFEAISPLVLFRAPKDKVLDLIKSNPDILYDLLSRVFKGIDGTLTRMSYLMTGNAYLRLVVEIIIQAKRFGTKMNNDLSIRIKISERDIASQAGLTRETISREMKKLKTKNLATFSRNILTITDMSKLESELD